MPLAPLPIDAVLPELIAALRQQSAAVLRAPTGSGKTTRVPPALLDAGLADGGQIVMLEPRRVAARAAARRITFERGGAVGGEVGYQVRFDQQISRDTRIRIVTDGVLLRMLQDDSFLESVWIVIFDEFHERGLNVDLALAMVRRVQQTVRPDLKIVVMSATLAAEPIAAFLGDCPVVAAEGQLFPVSIEYLEVGELFAGRSPSHHAASPRSAGGITPPRKLGRGGLFVAIEHALAKSPGDLLVFLPGVGEIRRATDDLQSLAKAHDLAVMPLYGDLPAEQQDAVLGPCARRKLILATNVAETSITIDGVTVVIDSGQARVMRFDDRVGLDRLELAKISRASADQRAGRAGRTQPGLCVRLWSERDHRGLAEHDDPEIRRVDLAGPVLQLMAWGETDLTQFPWFEQPREALVEQAQKLLTRLGAVNSRGITGLGRMMVRLPVHPRIARLLVEGQRLGVPGRAALAAAMLAERDPFLRPFGPPERRRQKAAHRSESDVIDRVAALEDFQRAGLAQSAVGELNVGAARFVLQAAAQLRDLLSDSRSTSPAQDADSTTPPDPDEALQRALLAAFPDRVALRREMSTDRGVMVGGRGVRLAVESAVTDAPLFVCVSVDAGRTESLVRQASAIRREWLDPQLLATRDDVAFDRRSGRVTALRRTCWDDLVLDEVALSHVSAEQISSALAKAAAEDIERVLPKAGSVRDYIERVRWLDEWMPELQLPKLDDQQLKTLLSGLCQGRRTLDDVRSAPWLDWIKGLMTPTQLQALEREAPERLIVPSGNRIAIEYKVGKRPVLAVRIQELFGLAETPRIASGRVPILLHLLAPNSRPQQVTDDLKSFWNNAYQQVRKDLRARYPKHAWPEDPWNAVPQRRPNRK
ncbi:MAG: DEAD/DEAH box helicase [Planctomycetaceae bacterium]|nr:DEAD/DEAH box helicase [Planctomycetaceae bacterium]